MNWIKGLKSQNIPVYSDPIPDEAWRRYETMMKTGWGKKIYVRSPKKINTTPKQFRSLYESSCDWKRVCNVFCVKFRSSLKRYTDNQHNWKHSVNTGLCKANI